MMWILADAAATVDAVPQWVGALSMPALVGALLYYMVTVAMPRSQDKFHEQMNKERESHERVLEKTIQEFRDANKAIVERDERKHEQLMAAVREIPSQIRMQV